MLFIFRVIRLVSCVVKDIGCSMDVVLCTTETRGSSLTCVFRSTRTSPETSPTKDSDPTVSPVGSTNSRRLDAVKRERMEKDQKGPFMGYSSVDLVSSLGGGSRVMSTQEPLHLPYLLLGTIPVIEVRLTVRRPSLC